MFKNIVIGISGGVDSAISALLLKQKGYNVLGVFMKNWDEFDETGSCSGEKDYHDAEYTCKKLGIELHIVNFVKDYWNYVFSNFLEDYQNGLTPNPDILCNRYIKFDLFYKYAIDVLKYDAIATGHYAKTNFGAFLEKHSNTNDIQLLIPHDHFKDQTFFLSGIQSSTLCRTMFPLSDFLKHDVKKLACQHGLARLARKKESTGLCFVGNRDFKQFIKEYIRPCAGNFIDIDTGRVVGAHKGIHEWTVGQRCRLPSFLQPYFVAKKDVATNTLYVAAGHEHPALHSDVITANRHTKPLVDCTIQKFSDDSSKLLINLERPLRAITPGQYAVFYSDVACLGSARIISSTRSDQILQLQLQQS